MPASRGGSAKRRSSEAEPTLQVLNAGTKDDGSARNLYVESDPSRVVIETGPISGHVELADGTIVDVSAAMISVESLEVAQEISHRIGLRHEQEGHPLHLGGDEPYAHLCTPEHCGAHVRKNSDPWQALALTRAAQAVGGISDPGHRHRAGYALGLHDDDGPGPASMTRASTAAENAALNGLDGTGTTNVIPDVSLHTGDPGTTGANENANAGSYSRLACSWNAASSGAKTNASTLTFTTAGSSAVSFFGTQSSATYGAGNYAIGGALSSAVTAVTIVIAAGAISIGVT